MQDHDLGLIKNGEGDTDSNQDHEMLLLWKGLDESNQIQVAFFLTLI